MAGASVPRFPVLLLQTMRPSQWTKNLLLFAGLVFSHNLGRPDLFLRALTGFGIFCLLSGTTYVLNDLADLNSDRAHPTKCRRPIASGALSPLVALAVAIVLVLVGLGLSWFLSRPFAVVALAYVVITLFYSHVLKHLAIVDVLTVAAGFVLRAVAGVIVIRVPNGPEVPMTPWFVLCVFFLALFLAICKRRHELTEVADEENVTRPALESYDVALLDQMISVSATATVLTYALYLITGVHDETPRQALQLLSTLPFVLYGIFRYLMLVYRMREGGEPERVLLRDRPMMVCILLWVLIMMYLHRGA